jgi:hypothetical protein
VDFEKLNSLVARGLFFGAVALLCLAAIEWTANVFGLQILKPYYTAGRMLEFAAIFLIFVIAILLRQVREELKKLKK